MWLSYGVFALRCGIYTDVYHNLSRLLDALDFALNGHTIYFFLVTNYTNPVALSGKIPWSLSLHVLITVRTFLGMWVKY